MDRPTPPQPYLHPDAAAWRPLAWLAVAAIAALLVLEAVRGDAVMATSLAIFLAASLGIVLLLRRLPGLLALLLVCTALLNGAGGTFEWFDRIAWFDEVVHLFGGFAGLAAIGYLYAAPTGHPRGARLVRWCAGMGLVLGIGWEVVEALLGELGAWDTATDIVMDVIGAALGGAFAGRLLPLRAPAAAPEATGRCALP